uniref:Glucagon / GIP / secretin / VIP family domain-containing protein n=1 Tax=Sinocyclocheilus grahami TaxID=75366 RepID=A0A672NPW9_SINGR
MLINSAATRLCASGYLSLLMSSASVLIRQILQNPCHVHMLTRCVSHMRSVADNRGSNLPRRRHVDGSFTSDVNKVLDSIAAKEYLQWVMNSKASGTR